MKKPADGLTLLLPLLALLFARPPRARAAEAASQTPYPPSRRVDVTDVLHGVPVADPYRWLEDEKSPEVQAWMKAQDDLARAAPRDAARARRDRRAPEGALLRRRRLGAPSHRGIALLLHAAAREQGEERSSTGEKGRRRGEGALRPERLVRGRQRLARRLAASRWDGDARRLPEEGQQLRRGDALRDGRRDREGLRRGRHRGRQVRGRVVDAGRQGLLLHVAARRPEDPGGRAAGLRGGALPPARRPTRRATPSCRRSTGDPTTFLGADLTRDGRLLFLAIAHGWTSTGRLVPRPRGEPEADGVDAARRRDQGALRRGGARRHGSSSRRTTARRRAASSPSIRRSRTRGAWKEIVPERKDATLEGYRRRRRAARPRLPEKRREPPRDPRARRQARARGRAPRHRHGRAASRAATTRTRRTSRSRRSRRRTTIYETSVKTGATSLYSQVKVPVDLAPYTVTQVFYPSKDGTRVSMFVVHRKDLEARRDARAMPARRLRRLPRLGDARLHGRRSIPWLERGGRLRRPEPARRRRVRRGVARGRDAPQEAERLRRLRGGGRVPREGEVDLARRASSSGAARTAACSSARR